MKTTIPCVLICLFLAHTSFLFGQCSCVEKPTEYADSVLCDNFEQYTDDNFYANANVDKLWAAWPGYKNRSPKIQTGPTVGDNEKSLYIENNGLTDPSVLLKLGNRTNGQFRLSWQMYISKDKTAHYNIRHNQDVTLGVVEWAFKVAFGKNGVGTVHLYNDTVSYFPFPSGEWMNIVHIIDLSEDRIELWINDEFVDAWKFSLGIRDNSPEYNKKLGSLNFYAIPNASFYVDNICLWENPFQLAPIIDAPVCIKNGKEFQNAEAAKIYGFYSEREFNNNGSCPDLCSYGGINIYNSEGAVGARYPTETLNISQNDILPNAIVNSKCLNNTFPELSKKQLRGKIYKIVPKEREPPVVQVLLIGARTDRDATEVIVLNCQTQDCAIISKFEKTDYSTLYRFSAESNVPFIVLIVAKREIELSFNIRDDGVVLDCGCECTGDNTQELTEEQPLLQNQKVSASSLKATFHNSQTKEYNGGEKYYSFALTDPGFIDLTISSPNMGCVCYLFDNNCSGNLLALANNADNGGTLSIHKYLEPGVYKIIVDQLIPSTSALFDLSFKVSGANSPTYTSAPCSIRPNNFHTVTIRNSPLIFAGTRLTLADRIYVVNESNKVDRERDALNWNTNQIQFKLYPATSETDNCGYKEGELISFVIRKGDKIYKVNPVYQSLDGELITASDRFKTNGQSLIIGFNPGLEVSTLNIGNMPNISSSQNEFKIDVITNLRWKISPKNGQLAGWYKFTPASGVGNEDITFEVFPNSSAQPRTDTLILTDENGFYKTFTLSQPGCTGSTVNAGIDKNICPGQNVTLTATGNGILAWQTPGIVLSPTFTTTLNATQAFTAFSTVNGCTASDQVTVNVIRPIANAGPDQSICAGQGVVLTASGGDTYRWSTNATSASLTVTPSETQNYTVTVSENGCEAVDTILVTVKSPPKANAGPDQSICVGQITVLNATGGGTYKWSNNETTSNISVSPLATQSYTLTVTQNDCEAFDQVTITVNPNPSIKKDSIQFKAGLKSFIAVSVTGGKAPYQYQWFRNDTLTATQEDLIGLKTGIYKLTVKDANGCSAGFGPELFIITSTRDVTGLLDLKIYPNPTQGQFRIEGKLSKKETVQVRILEATGKYIWKSDIKTATEFLYTPDLSNLAPGIYIIQLDVSGDLDYRKFILH